MMMLMIPPGMPGVQDMGATSSHMARLHQMMEKGREMMYSMIQMTMMTTTVMDQMPQGLSKP